MGMGFGVWGGKYPGWLSIGKMGEMEYETLVFHEVIFENREECSLLEQVNPVLSSPRFGNLGRLFVVL